MSSHPHLQRSLPASLRRSWKTCQVIHPLWRTGPIALSTTFALSSLCTFRNFCHNFTISFERIWFQISGFASPHTTVFRGEWEHRLHSSRAVCRRRFVEKTGMVTRNSWKIGLMHMPPHVVSRRKCSSLHLAVFLWKKLIATSQCQKVQKGVDVCWPWQRHML